MNLVWHLVRTDLRRVAWSAAVWLALVALPAWWVADLHVGDESVLAGTTTQWIGVMAGLGGGLTVMQALAGLLLAGQMVLEDPVEGTNAHWLTRPITGGRLLAAKLAAAALIFAVAPVAVLLPVWLAAGFGAGGCAVAAGEWALRAGGGVVAAMALAALAKEFSQFAISGMAALLLLGIAISRWPASWIGREAAFNGSPYLLFGAVVLPVAAAVLVMQYRTRRTNWGWALLGAGLLVAMVARIGWTVERAPAETRARAVELRVAGFTLPTPNAPQAAVVEERWRGEVLPLQAGGAHDRKYFLRTDGAEARLRVVTTGEAGYAGLRLRVSQFVREDGGDWPEGAVIVARAE